MRYFSLIFCGLLLYIFLGCGDPVEKQINEINRIKLLHEEIAKIIRQQETNIKTETLKLKDYVDLVEPALTRQMSTIESFERAIATCQRAIKTGTNPPEWITWNNDRLQYERILNMELSQDDWDSADITRSYLKSLKTQEPLSLKKCRDYLPTAKESLATHRRDLEMGTKELKQRRDSFTKQVDKMMKDLAKAQAAFDSLNTMHTEAVFALSKLKK